MVQKIFEILSKKEGKVMSDNRRVKMTKKMIKEAMIELLDKKPLEKISVTEICKSADVNRSTFYAYYEDVGSLMLELEDDVLSYMTAYSDSFNEYSDKRMIEAFEEFFNYVKENEKLFRVLVVQRNSNNFNHRLLNTIMEKYKNSQEWKEEVSERYTYIYSVSGMIGILIEWINGGFSISPKKLADMVWQMCVKALRNIEER